MENKVSWTVLSSIGREERRKRRREGNKTQFPHMQEIHLCNESPGKGGVIKPPAFAATNGASLPTASHVREMTHAIFQGMSAGLFLFAARLFYVPM